MCALARSQEKPYFVTYTHDLEEPGNLEIETKTALAQPESGNRFGATALELEYGLRAWWTASSTSMARLRAATQQFSPASG